MSLFDSLSRIAEQIQQQRQLMRNEEATLQVSIRPFIEALGYSTRNLAEVAPQYTADPRPSGTDRVDYAILRESKPVILVEAKAAIASLTENNWKQLHDYFNAEEVRFGILTNGIEYRFYTDLSKRNIMDKQPFLAIDMLKLDEQLVTELEPFTRAGFDAERIIASAKIQRIVHLLQQEMVRPSDGLVRHFAGQMYSGNVNARIVQEFTPLVIAAWSRFVEQSIVSRHHYYSSSDSISTAPSLGHETKIIEDVVTTISSDCIHIPVYAHYEGEDLTARFIVKHGYKKRNDKVISYNGTLHSVSGLAKELKSSIHRKLNMKKAAETAGWTEFWYYKDAKTKAGPIDDFRKDPQLVDRYLRKQRE